MTDKFRPLVTIGIPTYNRANSYLKQSLGSAVDQTYKNIEIIVSDNCSSDNTETVVKSFNDSRIRYFKQNENIGANNNINFCLEQAKGIFLLILLDDDLVDNDFIEVCINAVGDDANKGFILTGAREIDSDGNLLHECPNRSNGLSTVDFFLAWFDNQVPLYLCSILFNTRRLKELGGFQSKTNNYQDVVAEAKLAFAFGRADIKDVKASFRRHGSNMSLAAKVTDWCEDSLYLLDVICRLADKKEPLIRHKGMEYFCIRNYRHAAVIKSPFKRLHTYLMVYKRFNYCMSPFNFIYTRDIKPKVNSIKGSIKNFLPVS